MGAACGQPGLLLSTWDRKLPCRDNLGRERDSQALPGQQEFSLSGEQQQRKSKDWWDQAHVSCTAEQVLPLSSERRDSEAGGADGSLGSSAAFLPLMQGGQHFFPGKVHSMGPDDLATQEGF